MAKTFPGEITLICLAPMTNIALAMREDKTFASSIKSVVAMGGTYLAQGNTLNYCTEFNFLLDAKAAQIVFDTFDDITLVPYEACKLL